MMHDTQYKNHLQATVISQETNETNMTYHATMPSAVSSPACWHVDLHPLCSNHYLKHLKLKFTIYT